MAWSMAFQKCIFFHFLEKFFCKHSYFVTGFCKKKFFFADSKSRAQQLSNDVSSVIFEYQTLDLEGGGGSAYPGFQVPQQG